MGISEEEYSTKDFLDLLIKVKDDFGNLRTEMQVTRETIKKYNGLREEVGKTQVEVRDLKEQIDIMIAQKDERSTVWTSIRNWGGWILGIVSFFAAYWKIFIH